MRRLLTIILIFFFVIPVNSFGDDFEEVFNKTSLEAKKGDYIAQNTVGYMYEYGKGVPLDYKKAFYWYKKSSEQGNDAAQYNLAYMYYEGRGTKQSYIDAFFWFQKSSEKHNCFAQFELGNMYEQGQGTPQNFKKAYILYSLAAIYGYEDAIKKRDIIIKKLTPQQIAEAQKEAAKL